MIISILIITLIIFVKLFIICHFLNKKKLPKGLNNEKLDQILINKKIDNFPDPINRDRYLSKKLPQKVDTIIIGAGMSGLAAASVLSRVGKSVLVLEQHYVAGGTTHEFKNNKYKFETGVHYLGGTGTGPDPFDFITYEPINKINLGSETKNKMFDLVYVGDKSYQFVQDKQQTLDNLIKEFPDQKQQLQSFFSQKRFLTTSIRLKLNFFEKTLNNQFLKSLIRKYILQDHVTVSQAYKNYKISNPKLKRLLNYFTYLLDIDNCDKLADNIPQYWQVVCYDTYTNQAWFPSEGSEELGRKILPTIYANGNQVLVGKKVSKLILNKTNDKVIGVEMETGDIVQCNNVISTIGICNTYEKLLQPIFNNLCPKYQHFKSKVKYSQPVCYLFFGLKGSATELNLPTYNIWEISDVDEEYQNITSLEQLLDCKNLMYFLSFGSAKLAKEYQDKDTSSCIVLLPTSRSLYDKWQEQSTNHREQDYNQFKDKLAQKVLNELIFKKFPNLKEKIDYYSVGTPLTVENYLQSYNGNTYGLAYSKEFRQDKICQEFQQQQTPIKGLYLAGQDINGSGVITNVFSGLMVASKILGYWNFSDLLLGRDFFQDWKNLIQYEKQFEEIQAGEQQKIK